jgi:signal transduction histidine kinase
MISNPSERSSPSGYWGLFAYWALFAICGVVTIGTLTLSGIVALASHSSGVAATFAAAASDGSVWARGVLAAVPSSEPLGQMLLDYAFSSLNLVVAIVLLIVGGRNWVTMLLALGLMGWASAFNLQTDTAEWVVETAVGQNIMELPNEFLHVVTCVAYLLGLLLFPTGRWQDDLGSGSHRRVVMVVGTAILVAVGLGTTLFPYTISSVLFSGLIVPLVGSIAFPRRIRRGATSQQRTQARLLFSVLAAAFCISVVLWITTLLLQYLNQPGLTIVDPSGQPTGLFATVPAAPLFWFSRLASTATAAALLVAGLHSRLWRAEQLFSRGLAATVVVVLAGGAFVVLRAVADQLTDIAPTVLAIVLVGMFFLPLYTHTERVVDRLLYGSRPTPYSVLADLTALSQSTSSAGAPDLAGLPEAIAKGLGASSCRLTVIRPGLQDRTYTWVNGEIAADTAEHVSLPIRLGDTQVGTVAVDRAAIVGLNAQRHHLLEDIADSLGAVLQVSRLGIELERQLRAALAHAEDIAISRRQAVAEMDNERRTIERNLHDGAQHHLVSLRVILGLVEHEVANGQIHQARDRLGQLTTQINTADAMLADTATGVCSILLADRGLIAALRSELSAAHPPIAVTAPETLADRRFSPEVEAAVYFCCLEAVNNARKHARGAAVGVQLREANGFLHFAVHDDGPGFTVHSGGNGTGGAPAGRGLRNVTARIASVGGEISIQSAPGAGTTIEGSVPLPRGQSLLDQVRKLLREMRDLYDTTAERARLRGIQAQLNGSSGVGAVNPADRLRRSDALKARSALRELDAVMRSSPLGTDRANSLRYQLEQIHSEAHELNEIDLLDVLRSGTLPLTSDERQVAEGLLGATGAQPWNRLGLRADANPREVRRAAELELDRWQRRASHPASTRAIRDAAEILVRTCEELLTQVDTPRAG